MHMRISDFIGLVGGFNIYYIFNLQLYVAAC